MKYLIMIVGASGAGKTTLAHKMLYEGFLDIQAVVDFDDYLTTTDTTQIGEQMLAVWKSHVACGECMRRGENVAVCNPNLTRAERFPFFQLAYAFGYKVVFVHLTGRYKNVHGMSDEVVMGMEQKYQPLSEDELKYVDTKLSVV